VILKSGVPVGLAEMASVARLGEQAEIGQPEFPNQRPAGGMINRMGALHCGCQRETEQQQQNRQHGQGNVRLAWFGA
jgi:hypothetical protein